MKPYKIISLIDFSLSVILFIVCAIILPDPLEIQLSFMGSGNLSFPKFIVLAIPTLIGLVTSSLCFFSKETRKHGVYYVIMAVGIVLLPFALIDNQLMWELI